ncbi:MAG: ABC transporter ATP-binding protein [Planctomycetes bacterium]|nr:ABC transporter ATP-binding protein [Planctomycetota bacterium]MCB9912371.1 ABC transporter ATP-binding protein [Planctomycetota bacterium]
MTVGFRLRYALAMVSMAIGILLVFLVPKISGQIIDGFPAQAVGAAAGSAGAFVPPAWLEQLTQFLGLSGGTATWLTLTGLLVVCLTAAAGAFQYLRGRLAAQASEGILRSLRMQLYRHLMELPAEAFDRADTGDLVQRCTSDVDTVRLFLSTQVVEIGRAVMLVACSLPLMFALDVRLTWVSISLIPIILGFSMIFFRRLTRAFQAADEAEGRMTSVLQENLTGIRVVRSFGRQDHEEAKFEVANGDHRDRTQHLFRVLALFWSLSDVLCLSQLGLVLFAGAHWTMAGSMTLGTLVAFTQYSALVIWPVRQMGRILVDAGKAGVSLKRLTEILDQAEEAPSMAGGPTGPLSGKGALSLRGVSFRFPVAPSMDGAPVSGEAERDRQGWVLQDVDLELRPGQTLGLVGPPGSGKSALVQLLLGLYDYQAPHGRGSIQLDGVEIASLDRHALRSQVAAVLQNPFLFAKSIESNLRVGHCEAERDELRTATEAASLHSSIESFESGYDTLIGERGVTLSGGQKQRMAIARALLKPAPVLILDDALSAVDHQTEQQILAALKARAGQQTTIVISHRLSSVAHADEIVVLNAGRIVERGCHQQLIASQGAYAHLWHLQHPDPGARKPGPVPTRSHPPTVQP